MSKTELIGLGALNIDHIYKVARILEDGETVVREAASFPGGSAANTVYGLAKLGVKTGFFGAVGDDAEGRLLVNDFQQAGVDTGHIRIKAGAKSGAALCLSDDLGRRSIYVLPGANSLLSINDVNAGYINRAKWLHVTSFVDDAQFRMLLELTAGLGASTKVSFSPGALYAGRGLKALEPVLARAAVLFINQTEIEQLTGEPVDKATGICLKLGCQTVVVTLGKGTSLKADTAIAYIRTADSEDIIEPNPKDTKPPLDATGAGDAFATGFLYGLLNGKVLKECGHLGNIVAQFSITKVGAREGLPTFDELSQRYQQLYNQRL